MEITEVKVFPINEEKLKAFVSIVFDQCFMVNDIKIIQGRDGLFISMPSRKKKNGEFKDVAHPLNNETRRMIETKVLAEYERVLVGARRAAAGAWRRAVPQPSAMPGLPMRPDRGGGPEPPPQSPPAPPEKTLEEVEEMHLRDSFWTVTKPGPGTRSAGRDGRRRPQRLGRRQAVRHGTLDPASGGSNPPAPTNDRSRPSLEILRNGPRREARLSYQLHPRGEPCPVT